MATPKVHVGALSPLTFSVDLVPSEFVPDLTVVTAATLTVEKPDGTTTSWAVSLANQTPSTLRLTHTYPVSPPAELDQTGHWAVVALLTTPSGVIPTEPTCFITVGQFRC